MKKSKRSQAWGFDLIIAFMIFSFAITVFFIYSLNQQSGEREVFENLIYDGNVISDIILSEGFPEDWNKTNVMKIGILTGNKINDTKLDNFYNLTQGDYNETKNLFNTKYDYYFFLDTNLSLQGGGISVEGIGKPGVDKDNINASARNLIKITRFTIYEEKPITAYLYMWET